MSWPAAQIDGFTLAAIACEDADAQRAGRGLAPAARADVTERARMLAARPASARRAWVRRTLQHVVRGSMPEAASEQGA